MEKGWNFKRSPSELKRMSKPCRNRPVWGGLSLYHLHPFDREVLLRNYITQLDTDDDSYLWAIFKIERMYVFYQARQLTISIDPNTGEVIQGISSKKGSSRRIPWTCPVCNVEIFCDLDDLNPSNIVCEDCYNSRSHKDKHGKIKDVVARSCYDFYQTSKNILKEKYKDYEDIFGDF